MDEQRGTEALPDDLRLQVEEIARRLRCDEGERTLEFQLENGKLGKTFLHHGPIRNEARAADAKRALIEATM